MNATEARNMWNCLSPRGKAEVLRLLKAGGHEGVPATARRKAREELHRWGLGEEIKLSRSKRSPGLQGGLHRSGTVEWSLSAPGWAVARAAWCPQRRWF